MPACAADLLAIEVYGILDAASLKHPPHQHQVKTVFKPALILVVSSLVACDYRPTVVVIPACPVAVQVSPASAVIIVTGSVAVAVTTLDSACPAPVVQNETPSILQVDSLSSTSIRITGLAVGNGRVRIRSGADGVLSTIVAVTVIR